MRVMKPKAAKKARVKPPAKKAVKKAVKKGVKNTGEDRFTLVEGPGVTITPPKKG